jgi:type IV pilus assembly protein PilM
MAFKSRQEGIEVLKWQLKKSLPAEPKDVHLDYQVLEKTETGRYRLAVALMVRGVLQQYEEVLAEAGYHAVIVDFHSLHLYNYYRSRLDLGEDFILVGIDDGLLGMQFFQGKIPCFQRHRRGVADSQEVFQEVNLSFAAIRESFSGFPRAGVFLHTDWEQPAALVEALRAAFEREVLVLDPKIERLAVQPLPPALGAGQSLVAAIGAAERLF